MWAHTALRIWRGWKEVLAILGALLLLIFTLWVSDVWFPSLFEGR
jgi:hypothetical protein